MAQNYKNIKHASADCILKLILQYSIT